MRRGGDARTPRAAAAAGDFLTTFEPRAAGAAPRRPAARAPAPGIPRAHLQHQQATSAVTRYVHT
jgi:hypothetical protein